MKRIWLVTYILGRSETLGILQSWIEPAKKAGKWVQTVVFCRI